MSYSIIAAIFFVTIGLSLSVPVFDNERNVLVRFYSDFAQLYRPATLKSYVDEERTLERYQFYFTEREYLRISEPSLIMLYTIVIERTVTYYPMPNFVVSGSRYFYRRDPKQNYTVEIELVNPDDRLFREVGQPNRYFYLPSFDELEYVGQVPVMPYYEVTFICNSSYPQTQSPLLSYIDRGFQYTPRYSLDLLSAGSHIQLQLYAYADVRNTGEQNFVIKGAELIAGDIHLNQEPLYYLHTTLLYESRVRGVPSSNYAIDSSLARPLGERASGTYVYELSLPSSIVLPGRSLKSIPFLQTNVTVESFLYYSSVFSPVNSNGKVLNAYNLTSMNDFLPNGRLLLREQGRFIGQVDLPNLSTNETYTMIFGSDAEVSYRRQVTVLQGDENSDSITYYVEYAFENCKPSRDVQVYFLESFSLFKNFQIQNISTVPNNNNLPNIRSYGTDLRGYIFIPRQCSQTMISYNFFVYKNNV
jgi:hypothetical protein